MPRLPPEHVSDFIRMLLPSGTPESQVREAQSRLDDLLDAIDEVHARLTREGAYDRARDNSAENDTVEPSAPRT